MDKFTYDPLSVDLEHRVIDIPMFGTLHRVTTHGLDNLELLRMQAASIVSALDQLADDLAATPTPPAPGVKTEKASA